MDFSRITRMHSFVTLRSECEPNLYQCLRSFTFWSYLDRFINCAFKKNHQEDGTSQSVLQHPSHLGTWLALICIAFACRWYGLTTSLYWTSKSHWNTPSTNEVETLELGEIKCVIRKYILESEQVFWSREKLYLI